MLHTSLRAVHPSQYGTFTTVQLREHFTASDDLMGMAIFPASATSNFVNVQIIYVDGGILAILQKPANEA
ncbi:MAG TPA: hypothetical protein VIM75_16670 [Ohtaekwangia sp.]|uniref:hypothetical protein n=1 Tax=Ohtaekwangia sp. TaxID=2066019 RepID=UPI002F95FE78